jgi:hypothetical protein
MNEQKATLFVVEGGVAHRRTVEYLGEVGPNAYFAPGMLHPGTSIVTEGRALLKEGDRVDAQPETSEHGGGAPKDGGAAGDSATEGPKEPVP